MKNRFKFSNRKSGGLVFCYKESLKENIQPVSTESKFVQWFKVSSKFTKLEQDILFGSVYIPPENTKYSSTDAFREIEEEFLNFSISNKYICLTGDFNSRTSSDLDFITTDDFPDQIDEFSDLSDIIENDIFIA